MMSAWQYAEMGPFTSSPAAQRASSETVIFWSASVVDTTTQTATPAIAITIPTTIAVSDAILFISGTPSCRPDRSTFTSGSEAAHAATFPEISRGPPPLAWVNASELGRSQDGQT